MSTQSATQITSSNATLNALVSPNSLSTTGWFQWGVTASYGNATAPVSLGNGVMAVPLGSGITGLSALTRYHYQAVASNNLGTSYGGDLVFSTVVEPYFISTLGFNPMGQAQIGFSGTPNAVYSLWASTNLEIWTQIGTSTETLPGIYQATDPAASNYFERFYQLRWP